MLAMAGIQSKVIPAQAGIQGRKESVRRRFHLWIPAFAGMTYNRRRGRKAAATKRQAFRHGRARRSCAPSS